MWVARGSRGRRRERIPFPMAENVLSELRSLPVRVALLTDQEGAVVLRASDTGADDAVELDLQRMAATFAQTADHANKLGLGRSRHVTTFYGECLAVGLPRVKAQSTLIPAPLHSSLAEKAAVVHVACMPLVLTLLACDGNDVNVGLILDAVPRLSAAIEPLRSAIETLPR